VNDTACVEFLQWALPKLNLQWSGFRKVRSQVCKRLRRRIRALGLDDAAAYRAHLEAHSEEWEQLDAMCRITISRFCRDRGVFDLLRTELLPELAQTAVDRSDDEVRCWCAGCAAGEEAYTLVILWIREIQNRFPSLRFHVTATDIDSNMLERARAGSFQRSSLRELPATWMDSAFDSSNGGYRILPPYRVGIDWVEQDVRRDIPPGPFDPVLCRNLIFTYFGETLQLERLSRIADQIRPEGLLVLGKHEALPESAAGFIVRDENSRIFQKD
jgi:chemotaxis protein methyltransferase CheR